MITDANKSITGITYNHLNLPTLVALASGNITYIYDASGIKQKKVVSTGTTIEYAGNYVYENGNLQFFNQPEGYIEPDGSGGYDYVYQYKDHLGNVRLSYKDSDGSYLQLNHDNFNSGTSGWSGTSVNDNGRLKVTVQNQYSGIGKHLVQAFSVGEKVQVKLDMDKYTTTVPVRVLVNERDSSNNSIGWYFIANADNGTFSGTHTIVNSNVARIYVKLDITPGIGSATQFYVDNIVVSKGELEIQEENNYYPFELQHKGYNNVVNGVEHPYKYNGKEHEEDLGLNMYDYGARNYDPAIARWWQIDPLAEQMRRFSPYNFAWNNPIFFIDPDGMFASPFGDFFDKNGKKIGTDGIDDGKKYVVTDKKQAKAIKKTDKSGGTTQVADVSSAQQLPSDATLTESVNVLDRQVANGGLKEEASIVMNDGTVVRSPTGTEPVVEDGTSTATTNLPNLPEGTTTADVEATIHSHPTEVQEVGEQVFPHSANTPSTADTGTFSQYDTNIIVGPLGTVKAGSVTRGTDGKVSVPNRSNGVVIYKRGQQPVSLKKKAVQRIIEN